MDRLDEFFQKIRDNIHSSDPDTVISALSPFQPHLRRSDRKEPLDERAESLIPDIQALLDDQRLCCLTPVSEGDRYYGEVRWNAATVLAHMFIRKQSSERVILQNVVRPFSMSQGYDIAKQNGFDTKKTRGKELFEMLHQQGLLRIIPKINFAHENGFLGLLFITGWIDYFESKRGEDPFPPKLP